MTHRLQEWHKLPYSDSTARYIIKKLRKLMPAGVEGREAILASVSTPKIFGKHKN
jgi:hypothetical protein